MKALSYTDAAGQAAQRYLEGLQRGGRFGPNVLPATFRWQECFDAMVAAAAATQLPPNVSERDLAKSVPELQRELLALCPASHHAKASISARPVGLTNAQRQDRIATLRALIRHRDPDAALYFGWGGPGDMDNDPKRRQGDKQ